ncbi:hypothetical protein EYF80_014517 [Liparis tanakae]|uniref:Uncharacterized protein n=1 Tax=Liparis tanakae TaxID=230148 RepID=A0A4Z2IBK5_9TELE|nr:hypothetical protein EYF80_014517 [Liparis tanakae]
MSYRQCSSQGKWPTRPPVPHQHRDSHPAGRRRGVVVVMPEVCRVVLRRVAEHLPRQTGLCQPVLSRERVENHRDKPGKVRLTARLSR